jgi:L-ascorbate metabolism protein UlaG (beta-lactamase superfamily)
MQEERDMRRPLNALAIAALVALTAASCAPAPSPAPSATTQPPAPTAPAIVLSTAPAPTVAPVPTASPTLAAQGTSSPSAAKEDSVTLTWLGQSAFVLTTSSGFKALLDPFAAGTGYAVAPVAGVDVVTVSHEHSDHNNTALATGSPVVLRGLAGTDWSAVDQTVKGVRIRTVPTYHDDTQGNQRGKNAVFVFEAAGLRLAHLGDLGHTLTDSQVKSIGPVDVVMIPVGGYYTVDGTVAAKVVSQLAPAVAIPMHYKTAGVSASLAGLLTDSEPFIAALGPGVKVEQTANTLTLQRSSLPKQLTVYVMAYR